MCILFAYIFLIGPEQFQRLAQGSVEFESISALAWGAVGDTIEYAYDDNGSLTSKTTSRGNGQTATIVETVEYRYNSQGRLSRIVTDPDPASGSNVVSVVDYTYNPAGIRVGKAAFSIARNYRNGGRKTPRL